MTIFVYNGPISESEAASWQDVRVLERSDAITRIRTALTARQLLKNTGRDWKVPAAEGSPYFQGPREVDVVEEIMAVAHPSMLGQVRDRLKRLREERASHMGAVAKIDEQTELLEGALIGAEQQQTAVDNAVAEVERTKKLLQVAEAKRAREHEQMNACAKKLRAVAGV